jgi:hypothetical protein
MSPQVKRPYASQNHPADAGAPLLQGGSEEAAGQGHVAVPGAATGRTTAPHPAPYIPTPHAGAPLLQDGSEKAAAASSDPS